MSLFSSLLEVHTKCSDAAGIVPMDKDGNTEEKKVFLPVFHMTMNSQIHVTIDQDGNFVKIVRDDKLKTIVIPCSEKSSSRSNGLAAHPLCDQLSYVDRNLDSDKFDEFMTGLKGWKGDNLKLNALFAFLEKMSIVEEMQKLNLLKDNERDEQGIIKSKIEKLGVRFSVNVLGDFTPNLWEDKTLQELWIDHQKNNIDENDHANDFDYLTGENITQLATNHPKNINSRTANAKLLSCNDTSGLTFRGRFASQNDGILVDALQSQKVYTALKWLISNYGIFNDSQVIVIFAVSKDAGDVILPFQNSFDVLSLFENKLEPLTDLEILSAADAAVDGNYSRKVSAALRGFGKANNLKEHGKRIVVAVFDAATTGRMGVTFFQELAENEYLENIAKWHEESAWELTTFKETDDVTDGKKANSSLVKYIGCPSFKDILIAAYGKPRGLNDKGYETIKKKVYKQLLECIFGNFAFPKSYVTAASVRASHPLAFVTNGSFDKWKWLGSLEVTCSLIKKYYLQNHKEEFSMELEKDRRDRDYLYGRLLAVANKLEDDALRQSNADKRTTNAVRLMANFSVKPFATWGVLWTQLIPYKSQLLGAKFHQNIIDEIMSLFKEGDYENNMPLSPVYLMGFSAQNRAFYNKKQDIKENENDNT